MRLYALGAVENEAGAVAYRSTESGQLLLFTEWAFDGKRPTTAGALAFNASGAYLASNRGLYRNLIVLDQSLPQITAANAGNARMQRNVTLAWDFGGEWVDVLRNGEVVASILNTGGFSERVLRTGGSLEYQVCNRFGEGCSEPVTLAP